MGREVRRVPPNWQHPKREFRRIVDGVYTIVEGYQPLHDRDFAKAMEEWYAAWKKWESGERNPDAPAGMRYHEWASGPPNPEFYQHGLKKADCTWFQVYETVSEGTPVTPPFATAEELAQYLAEHGDFWDQQRVKEGNQPAPAGWGVDAARKFVAAEWAPTMLITDGEISTPRDGI